MKLLACLAIFGSLVAGQAPDPNGVYVESISYGGSGCPQKSVSQQFAPDRTSFTLLFDKFVAQLGPGAPVGDNRKNCQLNINFHIPMGWQYSIAQADYRGYVSLDAGVKSSIKTIYYFQGEVKQVSSGLNFAGPVDKDYVIRDSVSFETKIWSNCKQVRPINANTMVVVEGTGKGSMTTDSIDGKVSYDLKFLWQRC